MSIIKKRMKDKIIYISDSPKELREMKEKKLPVIALLTEENKAADLSFVHYAVESAEDVDEAFAERVYCRAHHQPMVIGEDKILFLREFLLSDAEIIKTIYEEDKENFLESFFVNDEELEVYLKSYIENQYDFYGYGIWAICLKETGETIGIGGFSSREDGNILELGFAVLEEKQKRGYATEACSIMLRFAEKRIQYNCIIAKTKKMNKKAENVLEKIGFQKQNDRWCFMADFYR